MPASLQFKHICDIDFYQSIAKRKKTSMVYSTPTQSKLHYQIANANDADEFYAKLHAAGGSSVVLAGVQKYAHLYQSKQFHLPAPLSNLFSPHNLKLDYFDI